MFTRIFFGFLIITLTVNCHAEPLLARATAATVLIQNHLIYGLGEDDNYESRGTGSGFLVDRDLGLIMTNAHVVGHGHATNRLRFETQEDFIPAERFYVDSYHDIALLQIPSSAIPINTAPLTLDCEYEISRGDRIFTVGHPNDHLFTVTEGIISGIRNMNIDGTFFTSDQVIEPGSSGSAAVNVSTGKVIGIATQHAKDSDLSMLTRSTKACQILNLARQKLNPARPRLGFQLFLKQGKISNIVSDIFVPNHPLMKHDVITHINNTKWDFKTNDDLADMLRGHKLNTINLTIKRNGRPINLNVPITPGVSDHLRPWVHFSGMVFTTPLQQDSNQRVDVYPNKVLKLVQFERNYDDTAYAEYQVLSSLISINKIKVNSVEQVVAILKEAVKKSEKVLLELRGFDATSDAYRYSYLRNVSVEDLKSNILK